MKKFKKMITIGKEEFNSAAKVIKSGELSFFLGVPIYQFHEFHFKNLREI